jgi:hypothetical protein
MYLVPEEVMNVIQQRNNIQTSPYVKSLSSLNQQMNETLSNNNNIPDETKIKNYDQMLQRFLNIQEQRENHIPTVKIQTDKLSNSTSTAAAGGVLEPSESAASMEQQQRVSDSEILGTIPKKFRGQAEGLLKWVKKSPQIIDWNGRTS